LAAVVAVMTVVDPLVSIVLGSGFLGQAVRVSHPGLTAMAAPIVILGVVALARRLDRLPVPTQPVLEAVPAR
jgi:hypothetical protein